MTITELLEAHQFGGYVDVNGEYWDWEIGCKGCEWTSKNCGDANEEAHLAHVADVLERHVQEREAQAWDKSKQALWDFNYESVRNPGIQPPANPYLKESSDGR